MLPSRHFAISLAISIAVAAAFAPDMTAAFIWTIVGTLAGTLIDLDHFAFSILTKGRRAFILLLKNAFSYSGVIRLYETGGPLYFNCVARLTVHALTIGIMLSLTAVLLPLLLLPISAVLLAHIALDAVSDFFDQSIPEDHKLLALAYDKLRALIKR